MAFPRTILFAFAIGASLITGAAATMMDPQSKADTVVLDVTLNGTDLVSYYQGDGKPVSGNAAIAVTHDGKIYRFASEQNANAFKASPDTYLPQYGGHCAWAAAQGSIAPGDPAHYRVVNGKLYLNYNADVQASWVDDIPGFIAKADKNWPRLKTEAQ